MEPLTPIYFYASPEDLLDVMHRLERQRLIKYVRCGYCDSPDADVFTRAMDLPPLGPETMAFNGFLVSDFHLPIEFRKVVKDSGDVEYSVFSQQNPKSVTLSTGGVWRQRVLVSGSWHTWSEDRDARAIFEMLAAIIRAEFVRCGGFHVGPNALRLAKQGWRLTMNAELSGRHDFTLEKHGF